MVATHWRAPTKYPSRRGGLSHPGSIEYPQYTRRCRPRRPSSPNSRQTKIPRHSLNSVSSRPPNLPPSLLLISETYCPFLLNWIHVYECSSVAAELKVFIGHPHFSQNFAFSEIPQFV